LIESSCFKVCSFYDEKKDKGEFKEEEWIVDEWSQKYKKNAKNKTTASL
jgi:hypothetical protein